MENKYKCLKCGKILEGKDIDFGFVGIVDEFGTPIGTEFKDIHKNCGGKVEELIEKK